MPSKFLWNRSKGSKKVDQEGDHESDTFSVARQGSTGTNLDHPGGQYYRGSSNLEHSDHGDYPQQSDYSRVAADRASVPSSFSLPDSETDLDEGYREHYQYRSTSPPPESTVKRGIRDRLGLSSSRENVSEDDDRKSHHRDQLRSKLGFGRRASVKHKEFPSASQLELPQEPRLPSIAQSGEQAQYPTDFNQTSYEPSPIVPQFDNSTQYQAYRAPSKNSAVHQDYPPVEYDEASYSRVHHGQQSSLAGQQSSSLSDNRVRTTQQPSLPYEQKQQTRPAPAYTEAQPETVVPEPVYRPPEYKAPIEGVRRQESVRRQNSVHRKSVHQSASTREHRKSRSSDTNLATASSAQPPAKSQSAMPSTQQSQSLSRSNTHMQQSNDGEESGPRAPSDMSQEDLGQLIKDYQQLREKYSKVKRYYFEKDDQVKQLQNTLAHQRLSQSRTSLDDGEYTQRFTRLDGLISQLAFNFRKDWKVVPQWLQPCVNRDAVAIGKQEMTAVGRAFVSRWLADEIFDKYFSPALRPDLSIELKSIQKNIRAFHPPFQNSEEEEALTGRVINWRLSTVDGLQHSLSSSEAAIHKRELVDTLVKSLIGAIQEHMNAAPAGLEGGVHMIIELAVSILANLPFESRDVHIEYVLPGASLDTELMKIETGIPPLTLPVASDLHTSDTNSVLSTADSSEIQPDDSHAADTEKSERKGFLGGLIGNQKKSASSGSGLKLTSATNSQTSLAPPGSSSGTKESTSENNLKVRVCVFLGLQIRGKMVLARAPVYRS